ncbi:hypothetical protein D9615_001330 [Tricholomella constricta]|uniref:Uncharacterized protein n=1 Tax=Tricholomella constricta TaxID=117010 RepID=A0A8H5HJX1_9AGAR|nr:hypothetical protein D9615_001330 [Tricholomella constricta]
MVDLCYILEIRALLDDGSPWQSILSIRLNERITNLLPQAIAKWMSNAQADLICVLVSSILPAYRGMTHLAALTYVKCSFCGAVRSFAVAIFHSCVNKPICLSHIVIDEPYDVLTQSAYRRQRWSPAVFSIHDGSKSGYRIFSPRPAEATFIRPPLLKWIDYKPMAWRTALFHCLHSHPNDEDADVTWTCILKNRVPEGQADDEVLSDKLYDEQKSWGCARCHPHVEMLGALRGNTKREVVDHVVKFHGVERPVLGQDFYRALDSNPFLVMR